MKYLLFTTILVLIVIFGGCAKEPKTKEFNPFKNSSFKEIPKWDQQDFKANLELFIQECQNKSTQYIYKDICKKAISATDAKLFFEQNFTPFQILNNSDGSDEGLLTGYYEPLLHGSLTKKPPFIYPIYETPSDLLSIDLASQYTELKRYKLRGRVVGNRVVPYYDRASIDKDGIKAKPICFVDSRVDAFFLEIQGSGIVKLDNNDKIYVGYDNQNGYAYRSIGKYLVEKNELKKDEVSMQSIKEWLQKNPNRVDEVLHFNKSKIFFKQKDRPAMGAMGVVLKPNVSVAVDREFIELGSILFIDAKDKNFTKNSMVVANDTGGAIKGSLRADLFLGEDVDGLAGRLKATLKMYILMPNGVIP